MEEPHLKVQLTTPFGRFIERQTYCDIFCFGFATILLTAAALMLLPDGHTLKDLKDADFLSRFFVSFYFSAVTFTTLGYGDVVPLGLGRIVALIDAFLGMATTALLIGKIASERQYSMLLLLHTSDCQRRIEGFVRELEAISACMAQAAAAADINIAKTMVAQAVSRTEAISNYVAFHLNQSRLAEFGNEPSLKDLCKQLAVLQESFQGVFAIPNLDFVTANRCITMTKRLIGHANLIASHYQTNRHSVIPMITGERRRWFPACCLCRCMPGLISKLFPSRSKPPAPPIPSDPLARIIARMTAQDQRFTEWSYTAVTEWSLQKVFRLLPKTNASTWPQHHHKTVAKSAGFSNKLTTKCIDELIKRGKIVV